MENGTTFTGLNDRTAIVTGGAQGIGLAVARRLGGAGCRVILFDVAGSPVHSAVSELEQEGISCAAFEGDVTRAKDWESVTQLAVDTFGPVSVLVNNAGISGSLTDSLLDYDEAMFDRVIAINVKGVFLGTKYCARYMVDSGGAIINLSSISGFSGHGRIIAYVASKHAVNGLTRCAATELTPRGVRVNAVCPSPTYTPMVEEGEKLISPDDPDRARDAFHAGNPMGRYAEASEIADLITYLASDQASFISGALVPIDGGTLAS